MAKNNHNKQIREGLNYIDNPKAIKDKHFKKLLRRCNLSQGSTIEELKDTGIKLVVPKIV